MAASTTTADSPTTPAASHYKPNVDAKSEASTDMETESIPYSDFPARKNAPKQGAKGKGARAEGSGSVEKERTEDKKKRAPTAKYNSENSDDVLEPIFPCPTTKPKRSLFLNSPSAKSEKTPKKRRSEVELLTADTLRSAGLKGLATYRKSLTFVVEGRHIASIALDLG